MKLSHILYKVKDTEEAIRDFEAMGFSVCRVGFNPKIWFEDGTFIELFTFDKSNFVLRLLKLLRMKGLASKFQFFRDAPYGFIEYSLENERDDLKEENAALKKMGYRFTSMKMKKNDESGVKLRWRITFPCDTHLPFYVAVGNFKELGMPKEIRHENGAKSIETLRWGVPQRYIEDIRSLYEDERLELEEGDGFKSIVIRGFDGDVFNKPYYKEA